MKSELQHKEVWNLKPNDMSDDEFMFSIALFPLYILDENLKIKQEYIDSYNWSKSLNKNFEIDLFRYIRGFASCEYMEFIMFILKYYLRTHSYDDNIDYLKKEEFFKVYKIARNNGFSEHIYWSDEELYKGLFKLDNF